MNEIESESKFVWKFIFKILLTPITLLLILFNKKEFKDLFEPFNELIKFVLEPKFTFFIIVINIIIFFYSIFIDEKLLISLINYPKNLIDLKLYTLITSGFLHANFYHLIGNIIGIFIFGRIVEKKLGFFKTFLIYFGALIISNLFSSLIHLYILNDNIGGLGASGALMGFVSAAILLNPFYLTYEAIIPLPIMLVGWLIIYADISGLINPIEDGIGHFAHLGGFISIDLLMFLLSIEERDKLKKGFIINIASLIIGVILYYIIF